MARLALLTVLISIGTVLDAGSADAAPWCAHYAQPEGGSVVCSFATLSQCQASVSGVGGICTGNPGHRADYRPVDGRRYRRYRH
jgi:hypothetical protein